MMIARTKTRHTRLHFVVLLPLLMSFTAAFEPPAGRIRSASGIVISQIYGAGGNSGAAWRNDFVELFNSSSGAVDLKGWSVQYSPATGSSWQKTDLSGVIRPGGYYLIQEASSGQAGAELPVADITGTINASASGGKIALLNSNLQVPNGNSCPPGAVDLIGYGTNVNCFESTAASVPSSNASSLLRLASGCRDTDDNKADFSIAMATPRNSVAPAASCAPAAAPLLATGAASPVSLPSGHELLLSVTVTPAANPTSTAITATADLTSIGGRPDEMMFDDGSHGDANSGDMIFSLQTIAISGSAGAKTVIVKIADAQGRSTEARIGVVIQPDLTPATDQAAGSVLVFDLYRSLASNPQGEDTVLNLTNTDEQKAVTVHLFMVNGPAGDVTDTFVCLTAGGTGTLLASQIDPGVSGFMVAIAVDSSNGCPIKFNQLIGEAWIRLSSRYSANLNAHAFSAILEPPCVCDSSSSSTEIRLNGLNYQTAPRVVAASAFGSVADGLSTMLIIDRLGGSFLGSASTIGDIAGNLFNDEEKVFSFEFSSTRRQLLGVLSDAFPGTTPPLSATISSGRSGWLKLWPAADGAIVGSVLSLQSPATSLGGRHLHVLTVTTAASLTIPVFPPRC
jgi:hypothetical protein